MIQPLYYECHITLVPMDADQLHRLRTSISVPWRVANFALLPDRPGAVPKMFLSCRSPDYREIHGWAESMNAYLRRLDFPVTRVKIEACVFDLHLVGGA